MVIQHPTDCRCSSCASPDVIVLTSSSHGTGGQYRLAVTRSNDDVDDHYPSRPLNRQERRAAASKARHA